ncbi:MAG: bifunctional riboflavin kinase/FAD synthetase [Coriobacteriia bacterium]|nr:bifunctional riboflavin kinase/FAD synthetase [Coriobacteriia bacterium]
MTVVIRHEPGVHDVGAAAIALGVFDGVHRGHQALITEAIAQAGRRGVASCVLTFDRDPDQIVTPERAAPQLMTLDDKLDLIASLGPDAILVVPFDRALAALSPGAFLDEVVLDACRPVVCVVGRDFRFGHRAEGTVDSLATLGVRHGFEVVAYDLVVAEGEPVTSSRIRTLVGAGDVATAALLLGRPHRLHGTVIRGRGLGRTLGTPTANLDVDARFALPAPGVYAARATVPAGRFTAAVSVGVPPTFPDATCELEAMLVGFDGDLYGAEIMLEFVERLRDQRAFPDTGSLARAIGRDARRAAALLDAVADSDAP